MLSLTLRVRIGSCSRQTGARLASSGCAQPFFGPVLHQNESRVGLCASAIADTTDTIEQSAARARAPKGKRGDGAPRAPRTELGLANQPQQLKHQGNGAPSVPPARSMATDATATFEDSDSEEVPLPSVDQKYLSDTKFAEFKISPDSKR